MDAIWDCHADWSKWGRERYISYDITSMWNVKRYKWTYLQNRNRVTDIESKLIVAKSAGEG